MALIHRLRWLLALVLAIGAVSAYAQTFPKLTGRVVDDAHLLSPEQAQQIEQLSQSIEQASSRQLVVATIPSLQGYEVEDYGYKLLRAWGIGQKGANNGVILLVAPNEHKVRIEVGYGLEPIMTDALSNQIIQDTILPKFKAGDMGGGVVAGAQAIGDQLKLPMDAAEQRAQQLGSQHWQSASANEGIPAGLIFWLIIFAFMAIHAVWRARHGGRRHRGGIAPVILWGPNWGSDSGSSWGGGGGSSWGGGGGGGGFSGGGGSGGGGGASGSW